MNPLHTASYAVTRASMVGQSVEIDGRTFTPDGDSAYIEFRLSHAFPVVITDRTALHPQVVANSYRSLCGKVFNLAHLMKAYDPKHNQRDRILGTIMACEFPPPPPGGWQVQSDPERAPGIRAVAVLHKHAEWVPQVLETWAAGRTPFFDEPWTVSMENLSSPLEGGFLVRAPAPGLERWEPATPADLAALGYVYVPAADAPVPLFQTMDLATHKVTGTYAGQEVVFLVGGLTGSVRYQGAALVPRGKEAPAQVMQILAGGQMVDLSAALFALEDFVAAVPRPGTSATATASYGIDALSRWVDALSAPS